MELVIAKHIIVDLVIIQINIYFFRSHKLMNLMVVSR
jgi:hypothetical protein